MADRNINDCDPRLIPKAQAFLKTANIAIAPSKAAIVVTWRDSAAQDAAHAAGLSRAGAGQSPHNVVDKEGNPAALGFDFAVFDENGLYVTNGADERYTTCGEVAEACGLFWGGRWTLKTDGVNPDTDHVQMPNWRSLVVSPLA